MNRLPETNMAWANPEKRPAQAAIFGADAGFGGAATGARATDMALGVADSSTTSALGTTAGKTGGALKSSTKHVWRALKGSARETGRALERKPE